MLATKEYSSIREQAVDFLGIIPEDKIPGVLDYMRFIYTTPKNPLAVSSKDEMYERVKDGMRDFQEGRSVSLAEGMAELMEGFDGI